MGATLMRGSFVLSMVLLIFILKKHTFTVLLILDYFDFLRQYGLWKEIRRKLWEQFHNANWRMELYAFG